MTPRSLSLLLLTLLPLSAETTVPEAASLDHYEELRKNSPFALATAPVAIAPPPVEAPAFSNDFYVVGIANLGDAQFVTIATKDRQKRYSLSVGERTPDGITLASVEWQSQVGQSRVTLQKGEETGTITFDQAAMIAVAPAPVPVAAGGGGAGVSGQPGYLNQGRPNAGRNDQEERRRRWRERRQNWERRGGGGGGGAGGGGASGQGDQRDQRFQQWRQRQQSIGTGG